MELTVSLLWRLEALEDRLPLQIANADIIDLCLAAASSTVFISEVKYARKSDIIAVESCFAAAFVLSTIPVRIHAR